MTALCAGWARRDITPPVGTHMGGYWGRLSGATGVHDPLSVRVIVWSAGTEPTAVGAALVALDLVAVTSETVARMRAEVAAAVAARVSVTPDAVTVCCSHTHAGPLSLPFRGMGDVDPDYLETVCVQAELCARQAADGLEEVGFRYARTTAQIGVNRRQGCPGQVIIGENPDGPVAAHAHVLVMQASQGRTAILFQHACHPVVLGNANHEISADFPGAACRTVEERTGAMAVFINGAAGDINPRTTAGTFADVDALGAELGAAVADAASTATVDDDGTVAWSRESVELPLIDPPPATRAAVECAVQELKSAVRKVGAQQWARRIPEARLAWSRDLLALARDEGRTRTQVFEVHGLRIGRVALLGMEGEILVRYQLDLEREIPTPLVLCGYANGCIGYVPTADEYERGGYEVDQAYKVYPSVLMIAPESEAIIHAAARRVLEGLGLYF